MPAPLTSTLEYVIILISVLRVLVLMATMIVLYVFYKVLYRRTVFHRNLRLLLLAFPVCHILVIVPFTIKEMLPTLSQWHALLLSRITTIALYGTGLGLGVLLIERFIATVFVTKYEHISAKIPYIAIALLTLQWGVAITLGVLNFNGTISAALVYAILFIAWLASIITFPALPCISRRFYDKQMEKRARKYSGRYQSFDNIRTAVVLNRLVLFDAFGLLVLLMSFASQALWPPERYMTIVLHMYYILTASVASTKCLIVVLSDKRLRNDVIALFKRRRPRRINHESTTSGAPDIAILSVTGIKLSFPVEVQREAYFATYRKEWN